MRLGWKELIRRPSRFLTAGAALTLIVVLLLVLGGILDALVRSSTGLLNAQSAPLIVYSADSKGSLDRSRVTAQDRAAVAAVPGVHETSGLGLALVAGYIPDRSEPANVAVFGYQAPNRRVPAPPPPGQGYADETLRADGLSLGQTIELGSARIPVEVIGWVRETDYNLQKGLWVAPVTWRSALNENIPDAAVAPGTFQALLVTPEDGTSARALSSAIDAAVPSVTALTIPEAIAGLPGVAEQNSVFTAIIGVTFAVAGIVVALFFALLTIERVGLLGVLKAIGASSRTLAAGLTLQAVLIAAGALAVGSALALALSKAIPDTVPLTLTPGRFAFTAVGLVLTALLGSAISFRRIVRIDPASAVGGA
ncbi:MAG: ABC transporter permease [Planctomycetaceae bacterium]